jgi:hypothetical protein
VSCRRVLAHGTHEFERKASSVRTPPAAAAGLPRFEALSRRLSRGCALAGSAATRWSASGLASRQRHEVRPNLRQRVEGQHPELRVSAE